MHPELKKDTTRPVGIASASINPTMGKDKIMYLDSACSCHVVASLDLFASNTIETATDTITAVGGQEI